MDIFNVPAKSSTRTWTLSITVSCSSQIMSIFSPSHEIDVVHKSQTGCTYAVQFSADKIYKPDQDFELLFTTDQVWQPQCVLSES